MNIVDAIFNRIPKIVWENMAKTLMQEICDSVINDRNDPDPAKERHAKAQILAVFVNFLDDNFSDSKTPELSNKFKELFLDYMIKNIKHPMESFLENNYINLFVFKKILDTDAGISEDKSKILHNVLQLAIDKLRQETLAEDSPKNKAREVIQLIKDQLSPQSAVSKNSVDEKLGQTGGASLNLNNLKKQLSEAIQLAESLTNNICDKNKVVITKLTNKLNKILENAYTVSGGSSDVVQSSEINESAKVDNGNSNISIDETIQSTKLTAGKVENASRELTVPSEVTIKLPQVPDVKLPQVPDVKLPQVPDVKLPQVPDTHNLVKSIANPENILSGKVNDIQGNFQDALGGIAKTQYGTALESLKLQGFNVPDPGELSTKIIDKIFENFTPTEGKGYEQIREDIYVKFTDALQNHLTGPEGRQMYLRVIDPFLTKCVYEMIDSGAVAAMTIIHLIKNDAVIHNIIENALIAGFENTPKTPLLDVIEHISNELKILLETQNPLNKLYSEMETMGYDKATILQKQDYDYKQTLCSKYGYNTEEFSQKEKEKEKEIKKEIEKEIEKETETKQNVESVISGGKNKTAKKMNYQQLKNRKTKYNR